MRRADLGRAEGFAMVTAILVTMVMTSLSVVVIGLSAHNANQSAFDRKRVQAIDAAEAGINRQFSTIASTVGSGACSGSGTLPITPASSYQVSVQLYADWPPVTPMACPPAAGTIARGIKVTSKGTASTSTAGVPVTRQMESAAQLVPIFPQYGQAIFSNTGISLLNNMTVNGYAGNDGNVYTNGNFLQSNSVSIAGSVYAQGTADLTQGTIKGDLWANGNVDLHNATVFGNVTSSTGSITLSNSHVYGSAKAYGAITVSSSSQVDGNRTTGSVSGPPPQLAFPQITYQPSSWLSQGYTIQSYGDCASAKTAVTNGGLAGQSLLIRITATCTLSFTNNNTVSVKGNLAIVTEGGFSTSNKVTFSGASPGYKLFLLSPYRTGLNCGGNAYDVRFSNQTAINNLSVFAYTPCTVSLANNNAAGAVGQIIANTVVVTNQMILNYKPVNVPSDPIGYDVAVSYLREVVNGS